MNNRCPCCGKPRGFQFTQEAIDNLSAAIMRAYRRWLSEDAMPDEPEFKQ